MKVHAFIRETELVGEWDLKELIRQSLDPDFAHGGGHLERLERMVEHQQAMLGRLILTLVQGKDLSKRERTTQDGKEVMGFPVLSQLLRMDLWTEDEFL